MQPDTNVFVSAVPRMMLHMTSCISVCFDPSMLSMTCTPASAAICRYQHFVYYRHSYLSGNLLEHYLFGRYSERFGGGADSLTKLLQDKLLAWRNTGFCAPGDDAAKQFCLVPDKASSDTDT